jgi:hypothetical protein
LTNIDFDPAMLDEANATGVVIEDWFTPSELDDMQIEELLQAAVGVFFRSRNDNALEILASPQQLILLKRKRHVRG